MDNDFTNLPLSLERQVDGTPLTLEVLYPGRWVSAQIWHAQVGRITLYLLDTNISSNHPQDRDITDQLYGGDLEMRLKREIMLGIGGYRALQALNLQTQVYHMNEGHAAFLALERTRSLMETSGLSFNEAREAATAGHDKVQLQFRQDCLDTITPKSASRHGQTGIKLQHQSMRRLTISHALSLSTNDSVVNRTVSILNRLFPEPRTFTIRLWNGAELPASGRPAFGLILKHPAALRRMFTPPLELALGEAFIYGDFDIEGDIFAAFTLFDVIFNHSLSIGEIVSLAREVLALPGSGPARPIGRGPSRLSGVRHSRERDRAAIQ